MVLHTVSTVYTACYISREDAELIKQYAKENNCSLEKAAEDLYFRDLLENIYAESIEKEWSTESIELVELDDENEDEDDDFDDKDDNFEDDFEDEEDW